MNASIPANAFTFACKGGHFTLAIADVGQSGIIGTTVRFALTGVDGETTYGYLSHDEAQAIAVTLSRISSGHDWGDR